MLCDPSCRLRNICTLSSPFSVIDEPDHRWTIWFGLESQAFCTDNTLPVASITQLARAPFALSSTWYFWASSCDELTGRTLELSMPSDLAAASAQASCRSAGAVCAVVRTLPGAGP